MVSTGALLGITLVALGLVLTPGPNMVYLVSRSVAQGRRAGLISLLGVAAGFGVYLVAAVAGLAAVFVLVPTLYAVVKLAGAGYLLWLAWRTLRPGGHSPFAPDAAAAGPAPAAVHHGPGHQPAEPEDRHPLRVAAAAVHRPGAGAPGDAEPAARA